MTKFFSSAFKRITYNGTKAVTVGVLAAAAVATVAPTASASSELSSTMGCKGYWYNTAFHGYCSSVTSAGKFRLGAKCNYESDYSGKWVNLSRGYSGKFDYDECTFKVTYAYISYYA
ncbi:hypothetical protein OG594_28005 [Streptomyces sp. NBC_01214]|uniref:hypothetical protein n=1 Tax=Streptomyces sp. NBC_01214 TaxID=2903777 RepID=UPI00225A225B|nr:hypothetical protein [Streptomyces sp. NBC_01214]MCX4805411.1 hypothetical protein [Streptomyces sp. NBC_01214]